MKREFLGNAYGNGLGTTCGFWTSKRTPDKQVLKAQKETVSKSQK